MSTMKVKTYSELYETILNFNKDEFKCWLEQGSGTQKGWKLEASFRLFQSLECILQDWRPCSGNLNLEDIELMSDSKKELFEDEDGKQKFVNQGGDSSDHTMINRYNDKHIMGTTSKNLKKIQSGKLDILQLKNYLKNLEKKGYQISYCVVISCKKELEKMKDRMRKTSGDIKEILNREDTIVVDITDLLDAFSVFKDNFSGITLNQLYGIKRTPMIHKCYQGMSLQKLFYNIINGHKRLILGLICRSGKTYIMGGLVDFITRGGLDQLSLKKNYMIITAAPGETIQQYKELFRQHSQFENVKVHELNGKTAKKLSKTINFNEVNVIICSDMYLKNTTSVEYNEERENNKKAFKKMNWLKDQCGVIFYDECHKGGTTFLSQGIMEFYGSQAINIYTTATYEKPLNAYDCPVITRDFEDIMLCKNINNPFHQERFVKKHGEFGLWMINNYSEETIIRENEEFPEMCILTNRLTEKYLQQVIDYYKRNPDRLEGLSMTGMFLLKNSYDDNGVRSVKAKFQKPKFVLDLFYNIYGKRDNSILGFDPKYEDNMMSRFKKISQQRGSRFLAEEDVLVTMVFLPPKDINKTSIALKKLLEKYNVVPNSEIVIINSKVNTASQAKKEVQKAVKDARKINNDPDTDDDEMIRNILVLACGQCSLGVTINECDMVLLLNDSKSNDDNFQKMMRSMTPGEGKKIGCVVDFNIQRVVKETIINYALTLTPDKHPREAVKYLLESRVFNVNPDDWEISMGKSEDKINKICEDFYELYSNDISQIKTLVSKLKFKKDTSGKYQDLYNHFNYVDSKKKPSKEEKEDTEGLKSGVVKVDHESAESKSSTGNKKEEKNINIYDLIRHLIPLVLLVSIKDEETNLSLIWNNILKNEKLFELVYKQIQSWWGKDIEDNKLKELMRVYITERMDKSQEQIWRTMKEVFLKAKNNRKNLSKLIDDYLIPQEMEKKKNAEFSTPYKERREMLDLLPKSFWTSVKKVFEPCSGKGGFLIDIVDLFMDGLKSTYEDEEERYRVIVEDCLYFSDINDLNIFICKLLIDPENKYNLNYNYGDTLELDITKTTENWKGVSHFDAVIGNPPYNIPKEKKRTGGYGGTTLWDKFVKYSIDKCLIDDGKLVFIHPPSWRKPEHDLWEKMTTENTIITLKCFTEKQGKEMFGCGVTVDYYLLEKTQKKVRTKIIAQDGKTYNEDLTEWKFLPSGEIDKIKKILAKKEDQNLNVMYSSSIYDTRRHRMSVMKKTEKNNIESYYDRSINEGYDKKCIHSMTQKGIGFRMCNEDAGQFGTKKVILSFGRYQYPYNDYEGEYGMTQVTYGLEIDNQEEGDRMCEAINTDEFKSIIKYTKWTVFHTDWRMFKYFKKDFWREFVNVDEN